MTASFLSSKKRMRLLLLLVLLASCGSLVVSEQDASRAQETLLTRRLRPSKGSKTGSTTSSPTASSTKSTKKSSKKSGTPCISDGFCDVDGNGVFDKDDLNYVARTASDRDPLGLIAAQEPAADVNEDGVVDLADYRLVLTALLDKLGTDEVGGMSLSNLEIIEHFSDDLLLVDDRRLEAKSLRASDKSGTGSAPRQAETEVEYRMLQGATEGTCGGGDTYLWYKKGAAGDFKPLIPWKSDFPYDPAAVPTEEDYANWEKWANRSKLVKSAAYDWAVKLDLRNPLPDAIVAYDFYRDNSTTRGDTLRFDLEKVFLEEPDIKYVIEKQLEEEVATAIASLHDGREDSFDFHMTLTNRSVYPETENWQKGVGEFRYWFTGTVKYDKTACELVADVTVHAEDLYNFNKGGRDIKTKIRDEENGRFEVLGWAKPFYSRGELQREVKVEVGGECCIVECPVTQVSGGKGIFSFTIDVSATQGVFLMSYNMYSIKDMLTIYHETLPIFSTGDFVSGSHIESIAFGWEESTSTLVKATITAPDVGTQWQLYVGCAVDP